MGLFSKKKDKDISSYLDRVDKKPSLSSRLIALLGGTTTNNDDIYEQIMVLLIESDCGIEVAKNIVDTLKAKIMDEFAPSNKFIMQTLNEIMVNMYTDYNPNYDDSFIMLVGINGSGKTTTISKLTNYYLSQGKTVGLIAADTFRAGAVAQINEWANRLGVHCVAGKENADPSSVLVDGVRYYKENPVDVIIADTAGRLQNKANLMKELEKMVRVTKRELQKENFEIWLTLDSTIGQNSLSQAEGFFESSKLTGVVLTKMDGSSKGGIVLSINNKFKLPVRYITYGENVEAIKHFDIESYISELVMGK